MLVIDPALVNQLNLLYKLRNLKWMQSTWAGLFIQQHSSNDYAEFIDPICLFTGVDSIMSKVDRSKVKIDLSNM